MCNTFITLIFKIFKKYFLCNKYTFVSKIKPFDIKEDFKNFITTEYLYSVFIEKFQFTSSRGIDGKTASHINLIDKDNKFNDLHWISNNLRRNTYNFNYYQESLINKGKNKYPRVVSKPTIKDKIVLYSIKEYFKVNIKESITIQPNEVIDNICEEIKDINNFDDVIFYKTDIKGFYDELSKEILLHKLDCYLEQEPHKHKILKLIKDLINTKTIPFGVKKSLAKQLTKKGVPQGLSISNILANIYMFDLDNYFNFLVKKGEIIGYHRYVDDILIIANKKVMSKTICKLKSKILNLELKLHKNEKTESINLKNKELIFLGYVFKYKEKFISKYSNLNNILISPKKESLERFFKSIVGMFSTYSKNLLDINKISKKEERYEKIELLNKNFIFRLNIKISGCINNDSRYGFFAYFSKTTSPYFAYRLKKIIGKELNKLEYKSILNKKDIEVISSNLKDPISAYFSTQNIKFFKRYVIINFDEYMNFNDYVNKKGSGDKKSPLEFIEEYDKEFLKNILERYNNNEYELRKRIYYRFNEIKNKNLDLLNKDISSTSSSR